MLTTKFFESFVKTFIGVKSSPSDADLMAWARTEYKHDAQWAFNYMKRSGGVPPIGDSRVSEMVI